ncbi:hypothetical protein [Parvularcula bermudensis]|uniref:hypothetical protein n=1 Tax=Parvularcula bermudensis TaxID=208216 RepID=UPI000324498F|nr:hypothetical protein [Parvularcula bermudensis]
MLFLIHVALSLRHLDRDRRREEPIQRLKLTRHLARRLTAEEQKCFLSLSVERQRTVMKWPPKKLKAYLAARREE